MITPNGFKEKEIGTSVTWLVTITDLVSSQSRNRKIAQNKSKTYQVGST